MIIILAIIIVTHAEFADPSSVSLKSGLANALYLSMVRGKIKYLDGPKPAKPINEYLI